MQHSLCLRRRIGGRKGGVRRGNGGTGGRTGTVFWCAGGKLCAAVGSGCDGWAKGGRLVGRGFGMGVGRQDTVAECRRAGAVRSVRCGSRQAHGAEGWRSLREPRRTQRREERPLSQALTRGCGSCCFLHMGCWHFLRRNVSSSRGSFCLGCRTTACCGPCILRLPRSVLCLGGRELRAARLYPFPCGLGAVCAFVRFPIAVFQYAASGLLVLDKFF